MNICYIKLFFSNKSLIYVPRNCLKIPIKAFLSDRIYQKYYEAISFVLCNRLCNICVVFSLLLLTIFSAFSIVKCIFYDLALFYGIWDSKSQWVEKTVGQKSFFLYIFNLCGKCLFSNFYGRTSIWPNVFPINNSFSKKCIWLF